LARERFLKYLLGLAVSLSYGHDSGLIHHDLKPANLYIPSDESQPLIVFDLGQALWRKGSWGGKWMSNEHNSLYLQNGTYRYMQSLRRRAHLGAFAAALGQEMSLDQQGAASEYAPSFYDDVFAYARIIREALRSRHVIVREADRAALLDFTRRLMGLRTSQARKRRAEGRGRPSGLWRRLFAGKDRPEARPEPLGREAERRYPSLQQVIPELQELIRALDAPPAAPRAKTAKR
jgi:serine/threonine protein kinase